jgi:uncharacterized protein
MASAAEILKATAHRPFPIPQGAWVMRQSWDELLFAHWKVPFNKLRPLVPAELELDTYEGDCYVGVVPFAMRHVRPRFAPSVPLLSHFLELNLRTYVKDTRVRDGQAGQGGVYFFSLDCNNPVAVEVARKAYFLPYYNALMKMSKVSDEIHYQSVRIHAGEPQLKFQASYRPVGPVFYSQPGSLESFLTERYCLLLTSGGTIKRGDIHHPQWPLQQAEADIQINTMGEKYSFDFSSEAPILHYAQHVDTVEWPLR